MSTTLTASTIAKTAVSSFDGTELLRVVQGTTAKKATALQLGAFAALAYALTGTHVTVSALAAGYTPLAVKGFASQTASLQEWQNSSGTVLSKIDAAGRLITNKNVSAAPTPQTGTLAQLTQVDGTSARMELNSFGAPSFFTAISYGGTNGSPTALTTGTQIGGFNGWGYDGAAVVGPVATFRVYAAENWSGSARGSYAEIAITANTTTAMAAAIRFEHDGGITVPSAVTGGSKGAGTINATNLYVAGNAVATQAYVTSALGSYVTSASLTSTLGSYATTSALASYAALASANTFTASQTISNGGLILSGSISAAAWTTGGIRVKLAAGTLTDTSSSGTVAAAYSGVLGGDTIAASSSTTFTDYYGMFLKDPVAGSNVTLTNKWSLGLEGSINVGGSARIASSGLLQWSTDLFLGRAGAASLRLGASDAASPVAQTISFQDAAGASNVAGAVTTFRGSVSTGTGAGGGFIFTGSYTGSSGSSQNTVADRVFEILMPTSSTVGGAAYLYNISSSSNANYERLTTKWDNANSRFAIAMENSGTGSARDIAITPGNGTLFITSASVMLDGSRQFRFSGQGMLFSPASGGIGISGSSSSTSTAGYLQLNGFASGADPSAPAASKGVTYVRDNGSGKGQFCVRFPTGAVQVLATEP